MEKEKIKIKEIIVVEGRDDVTAVKRVVDAQIVQLFRLNCKINRKTEGTV